MMAFPQFTRAINIQNFKSLNRNCRFFTTGSIKLHKIKPFGLIPIFASTFVQNNSTDSNFQETSNDYFQFSHRKLIQQSCSSSVNSTSELLTNILMAIIDSSLKYKNCMNYLISSLQTNDEIMIYKPPEESEDDIIQARIQAKTFKDEFMDLITMSEHIEKLAVATAEIAFLTGAETLAMLISERLYSVQEKIKIELQEVKKIESELLSVQKVNIEDSYHVINENQ